MKKRYRLQLWAFESNLADIQEIREDPEALLAARMGVRIRGAGGLQYFKSLLSAAHEQSDVCIAQRWCHQLRQIGRAHV